MSSVTVQIGLLAVAKDPARANRTQLEVARDRAVAAGHRVLAAEVVQIDEQAIDVMLARWIADPQIDAIIILHREEAGIIVRSLGKASGSTPRLAASEPVRCENTFVFVVSGAAAYAMDRAILPQFDPSTKPRNLVGDMPRLRRLEASGVPVAITAERTQGGSGLLARLPAKPAPRITKPPPVASAASSTSIPTLEPDEELVEERDDDATKPAIAPAPEARRSPSAPPPAPRGRGPTPPPPPPPAPLATSDSGSTRTRAGTPASPISVSAAPSIPLATSDSGSTRTREAGSTRTPTIPPAPRTSSNDLPQGSFVYPELKRRTHPIVFVVAGLALVALGFFGLIAVLGGDDETSTASAEPPAVASASPAPTEPAPPPEPAPPSDPAPTAPPPTESAPTPATTSSSTTSSSTTSTSATKPRPGSTARPETAPSTRPEVGPTTRPDVGPTTRPEPSSERAASSDAPSTSSEAKADPAPKPPDGCDEATCVLNNYDRPCCAKFKPSKPALAKRIGGVPETLDKMMVRAGIEPIKPRVVKCGEQTKVKGTVRVAMTVSPEGKVTNASLDSSPDSTLGECVLAAMKRAKFAASVNGASFTYPFAF